MGLPDRGDNAPPQETSAEQHNADGNQYFKQGDYETAYRHYTKAIKADRTVAKYWTNRANTLLRSGRTRQVIEDADAAIAADPSWGKGYVFRGLALEKLQYFNQAIEALQQAVAADPTCTDANEALNRCKEAKRQQYRQFADQASKDFCSDPTRACPALLETLQRGVPDVCGLTPQKLQQLRKSFDLLVKADALRLKDTPDFKAAAQLYKKAADLGSASGQYNYGYMIQTRQTTDQPVHAALPYFLQAADQDPIDPIMSGMPNVGVVEAWVALGEMHRDGLTGSPPDYSAAMQWYMKAAEAGNALAQNNIAQLYGTGRGVQKDMAVACEWYQKAAERGHGIAEYNLAELLYEGAAGVPRDEAAALHWARRAHQHGVAGAASMLAALEPSCGEAAAALRQAAESGDPMSCYFLAQAYFEGLHGCDKNLQSALKWLKKAARSNHPLAQLQLGVAYRSGTYTCQVDPMKALMWIEKAAYQGLHTAQLEAADCHMYGVGPKVDMVKARQWAQKAAAQGNQDAQQLLSRIKDKGQDKQWAKIVKEAQQATMQGSDSADAVLQHLLSTASMPDEAKSVFMKWIEQAKQDDINPPSMFNPGPSKDNPSDKYPLEALMQYEGSPSVEHCLQAKLALYAGMGAAAKGDIGGGIKALATGFALADSVMEVPLDLLVPVEEYLKQHPDSAAAQLVHLHLAGPSRGHHWMLQRMGCVLELAEQQLGQEAYAHLLSYRAELQMWPAVSNYEGVLRDIEAALQLLPGNADMLYVRAAALSFAFGQHMMHQESRGEAGLDRGSSLNAAKYDKITTAFREFLDAAGLDNRKRPHGFYTLALHTLGGLPVGQGSASGASGAQEAATLEKAEELYREGEAAEAHLPPFFLPVECSAKDMVADVLSIERAAKQSEVDIDRARSSTATSSRRNAGSTGQAARAEHGSADSCCSGCGKGAKKLMSCSRCKQVFYCSKECQVADWKDEHRKVCCK